jgi:RNA polymerase sigma factor (sigma-70 family)
MMRDPASSLFERDRWLQDPGPISRATDAQLLEQFLAGRDETAEWAFAVLVERHGTAVRRVCLDLLGDREDAQDAAQAVFLVLARKARSIREPGSLGPWLHGVAIRVARRARAAARHRREAERRGAEAMIERTKHRANSAGPLYPELHEEIDRLPDKYRKPIVLCDLQGHTQEEAARMLGWPYGTVQTRLFRGRRRLRDRLARRGVGLIGLVGSSLLPPSWDASAATMPPGWTEATARAAVRCAAGRGPGGFVAPSVTRLADAMMSREAWQTWAAGAAAVGLALALIAPVILGGMARPKAGLAVATLVATVPPISGPSAAQVPLGARRPQPASEPEVRPAPARGADEEFDQVNPALAGATVKDFDKAEIVEVVEEESAPSAAPARNSSAERGRLGLYTPTEPLGPLPDVPRPNGRELFQRVWTPHDPRSHGGDGLGPVFNGRSCVECHDQGGPGGAGPSSKNIAVATAESTGNWASAGTGGYGYSFSMSFGMGGFQYQMLFGPPAPSRRGSPNAAALAALHPGFQESRSLVLHHFGTDPSYQAWREAFLGQHGPITVRISQRNPTPLFGTGLIDTIPDEAILAASTRKFPGSAQVRGRASRLKGGRVGRFGWKAQQATLEDFILSAAATEIGLEIVGHPQAADPRLPGLAAPGPDLDWRECEALVAYVRELPRPVVCEPADEREAALIKAGETTFQAIGCASCHLPKLGNVAGLYSDLLLHDMGEALSDTGNYGVFVTSAAGANGAAPARRARREPSGARPQEWRTPPLWGLRDSAPYLHDGRAATLEEAIALHGGQGQSSAERYAQLSPHRKQQLEAFLLSLSAPTQAVERKRPAGED